MLCFTEEWRYFVQTCSGNKCEYYWWRVNLLMKLKYCSKSDLDIDDWDEYPKFNPNYNTSKSSTLRNRLFPRDPNVISDSDYQLTLLSNSTPLSRPRPRGKPKGLYSLSFFLLFLD